MSSFSNWREDFNLSEVVTGKMTDKEALKTVTEKGNINNKVTINPKLDEAVKEIGGEVISMSEADTAAQKQRLDMKQMILDRQKLKIRRKDFAQKKREGENVDSTNASKQADIIAQEETIKQVNEKKRKNALQIQKIVGESAVLDANTKISNKEKRDKMKKELLRLMKHARDQKKNPHLANSYEPEGESLDERLGGKGYKSYTDLRGKKISGDWEDSDRGAGNKAKKRAGGKVEKKSPTYKAHVLNKEEVIAEKDLNAAERRALPNKDFALPGKGKGPEGKQAGSYPIPDEKHARSALSLVAQHGTPEEKATVRAKVKKKFPNIQQESFEIDKSAHKAAQKKTKMRNLARNNENPNEKAAAEKKAGGPKLVGEGIKGQDNEMRRADAEDRKKGIKTRLSPSRGRANVANMIFKIKNSPSYKKEEVEVKEGVMKFVKSIGRKKKVEKKAKMDDITDKLHDWRQKNSDEQKEREKYVSPFRPIVKEGDVHSGQGEKIQKRTKAWMGKQKPPIKGAPGLDAMKARTAEHKAKRGVKEDKAFDFVVGKLKDKYGDGVLTKGDKMPELSAAQKKKNAEIRAKRAKEDHRDPTEKASDGRYSDRYSNRGSD